MRRFTRHLTAFAREPIPPGPPVHRLVAHGLQLVCAVLALVLLLPLVVLVGVVLYALGTAQVFTADGAALEGVAAVLALIAVGVVFAVGTTLIAAWALLWLGNRAYLVWVRRGVPPKA